MDKKYTMGVFVVVLGMTLVGCGLGEDIQEGVMDQIAEGITGSQKCTYSSTDGFDGVTYMDGDKIRSESTSPEGKHMMISDGEYSYTWQEGSTTGMKAKIEDYDDIEYDDEIPDIDWGSEDLAEWDVDMGEDDGDFECEDWNSKSSFFVPPTTVEFTDMAAIVKDFGEGLGDLSGLCDMLEGTDRDECIEGMESMNSL